MVGRFCALNLVLSVILCLLSGAGCGGGPAYPITSGSHVRDASGRATHLLQSQRYVVWANHAGVEHYLTGILLKTGQAVVERARLQRIVDEQNLRLAQADSSTKLAEAILAASKLLGASEVIFAEVQIQDGHTWEDNAKPSSVAIRSVSVETGEVRWAGTAHYRQRVESTDGGVTTLAYWALARAVCRIEDVQRWEEPSNSTTGGCRKKDDK